jgi:glycosylphosphatidylinositol transamidase (GPIT) subunit GPI8
MISMDSHKRKIIERIQGIDSERMLTALDDLLNSLNVSEIHYTTTESQKQAIVQGINEIDNGKYFSQEEIDRLDLEWLNGK